MKSLALLLFFIVPLASASLDDELAYYIQNFKLKPVDKFQDVNKPLFRAGKVLFSDNILSGNRNISCKDCHHPQKGTSDNLALSLGEGSLNSLQERRQLNGKLLRRHSPVLYNLGHPEFDSMFWDGRVYIRFGQLFTPEPALSGPSPARPKIARLLDSALSAQVIFPMVSHEEMRGERGSNPIANASTNLAAWELLVQRIIKERPAITADLLAAFPGTEAGELNIGHAAQALAEFIKIEFQVYDTPYDRYLRGDKTALDVKSKKGMKIYFTKGRCGNCHFGKHLTNHALQNVGVPPLKGSMHVLDKGRSEHTHNSIHNFWFKTPGLRNVALSAPYMHNGVFSSLEEVIEHYNSLKNSLFSFEPGEQTHIPYNQRLVRVQDNEALQDIFDGVFQPFLRRPLNLSRKEAGELKHFLIHGLTQSP